MARAASGVLLAAIMAGAAAAAPPPRVLDPATVQARTACSLWDEALPITTEDAPSVRSTPGVRRRGLSLTVRGEAFRDIRGHEDETENEAYYYAGALTYLPVDVVFHQPYEGHDWILVHRTAHDRITLPGLPILSPNGRLLAAQGDDAVFGQYGLVIVQWTPQGFTPVARFPRVLRPCALHWASGDRLEFLADPTDGTDDRPRRRGPMRAERRGGSWVLVDSAGHTTAPE